MKELNAYCINCKEVKVTLAFQLKTTDSGRGMAFGHCPACGGNIQRILGTEHQLRGAMQ
jgi:hypothetical protein